MQWCAGRVRRLPTHTLLRPIWSWEEDPYSSATTRNLWARSRKGVCSLPSAAQVLHGCLVFRCASHACMQPPSTAAVDLVPQSATATPSNHLAAAVSSMKSPGHPLAHIRTIHTLLLLSPILSVHHLRLIPSPPHTNPQPTPHTRPLFPPDPRGDAALADRAAQPQARGGADHSQQQLPRGDQPGGCGQQRQIRGAGDHQGARQEPAPGCVR